MNEYYQKKHKKTDFNDLDTISVMTKINFW